MTRNDIMQMAQKAGWEMPVEWDAHDGFLQRLERFAVLVANTEGENVAAWMRSNNYTTDNGGVIEDLLEELVWRVAAAEREACAIAGGAAAMAGLDHLQVAAAIRARGET